MCCGAFVLHKAPCPVPRGLHVGRLIPGKFFVILRSRIVRFHESFHHGSNDVRSNLREASGGCQCGLQGLVKDGINLEVCRVCRIIWRSEHWHWRGPTVCYPGRYYNAAAARIQLLNNVMAAWKHKAFPQSFKVSYG